MPGWIEGSEDPRSASGARTTVEVHHGNAICCAELLPMEDVTASDLERAGLERDEVRWSHGPTDQSEKREPARRSRR
jgi:hypothetical protein